MTCDSKINLYIYICKKLYCYLHVVTHHQAFSIVRLLDIKFDWSMITTADHDRPGLLSWDNWCRLYRFNAAAIKEDFINITSFMILLMYK